MLQEQPFQFLRNSRRAHKMAQQVKAFADKLDNLGLNTQDERRECLHAVPTSTHRLSCTRTRDKRSEEF